MCLVLLFLIRCLRRTLVLELLSSPFHGEPQIPACGLERCGDACAETLEHRDQLGSEAVHPTLDAANPFCAFDIKNLAIDPRSEQ